MQIRARHPDAYHSGEWGVVYGMGMRIPKGGTPADTRPCFYIEWPDHSEDFWPIYDPSARYQFRRDAEHPEWDDD